MSRKVNFIQKKKPAVDQNIPFKENNKCENCIDSKMLREEIQELRGVVETQNKIIMQTLAEHIILLKQIIYQDSISDDMLKSFPLKSLDELKEIDEKICQDNKAVYVSYTCICITIIKALKTLLKGKLTKKIDNVFSTEVIIAINIDGIHGKQGLKEYRQFFDTLLAAIDSPDPTTELRRAFAVTKKRYFHKVSIRKAAEKKRNTELTS
ncbi:uncharacterized protein [Eurosta solidaginis]|uniref:uncharacterized protein isoform X2 n=1 Tax=Eurosta solidaginis TaxID=178769 RepID=UPI0035315419